MDSVKTASGIEIAKKGRTTLKEYHPYAESALKGQIGGLKRLSTLEWIAEHVEQNKLLSKNILTNIEEQGILTYKINGET